MNERMAAITQTIIDRINAAINFAAPLAAGNPIQDTSAYSLDDFPRIDWEAQEAYDMAVADEQLMEQARTLSEASDRMSALFTMLCDLIPARDAVQYDFATVSMDLPYMTFTISALSDIVDELNAEMVMAGKTGVSGRKSIDENPMYRRIVTFVEESLAKYTDFFEVVEEFRQYAIQQMNSFSRGEQYKSFAFSFSDFRYKLMCSLDGRSLSIWHSDGWEISVESNGNVSGSLDSDGLRVDGMMLNIVEPDDYYFVEEDEY